MPSSEQKPPAFKVTDRRAFTGDGSGGDGTPAPSAPPAAPAPEGPSAPPQPTGDAGGRVLPPVDFSTFVVSLGSSALMHLGELEEPQTGKAQKDLPLAKHTIDLLSMLQAKTKGNLTPTEEKLIESLLYDLRIRYVASAKAGG